MSSRFGIRKALCITNNDSVHIPYHHADDGGADGIAERGPLRVAQHAPHQACSQAMEGWLWVRRYLPYYHPLHKLTYIFGANALRQLKQMFIGTSHCKR